MPFETAAGVVKLITYVSVVRDGKILLVEYVTPPNPDKKGWWIPAPEIEFGQDPADRAAGVLAELGLEDAGAALLEVESFTVGGAWHVIFHYRAAVARDITPPHTIRRHGWFGADDMPPVPAFAHGRWERELALRRIAEAAPVER